MKLIRDKEKYRMQLLDEEGVILLELGFIADEFVCIFYTTKPIVISESDDEFLYDYLQSIMSSEYNFSNKLSTKKEDEIIWFSDQYCDLENKSETDKVNRLIIRKEENKFVLSFYNPFFEENAIKRSYAVIAFSPAGNGSYTRNLATGTSFQDDFVIAFRNIMSKKSTNNLLQPNKQQERVKNINVNFLKEILLQDKPSEAIKNNEEEIFSIIPELKLCKNIDQNNDWHIYDVYEHILHVVDGVPNNWILRMAALFHDIGKPSVYTEDENGVGHFYGHWNKSKEIFDNFAVKYNLEEDIKNIISNLILYHDLNIDKISDDELKKLVEELNRDGIIMLFQLKRSDLLAQNEQYHYLLENYDKQEEKMLLKQEEVI